MMQLLAAAVFAVFGAMQPAAPPELRAMLSGARVEGTTHSSQVGEWQT